MKTETKHANTSDVKSRFKWETRGKALDANIVRGNAYRFTVLTPKLIRMEYDPQGIFEDNATQAVFFRDFPQTDYTVREQGSTLTIETDALLLTYRKEEAFSRDTLSIELKGSTRGSWHFGDDCDGLGGTTRTLDRVDGATRLEDGVLSRNGYAVWEDTSGAILCKDGWFELRHPETHDLYFFGYGHAYRECIADLYRLTGAPPLLPDYALGNWWSRYHKYTQDEYQALIERFERENIPFSVAVLDMDWHTTELPEKCKDKNEERLNNGWTGYSWNKELFPDYKAFLRFLHEHRLKTALNLHPAAGVRAHEDMYPEMAKACGIDPATEKTVKFDCLNPAFMANYFDILHHPYERDGVNFWWMDWQQGTDYWWIHDEDHAKNELEVIDPLWLLNHLHILDIEQNGKRPMFFSRYAGVGSHRYPVGFSGDTIVTWNSLDFQPYFTATASNIGYGWWSHDIGGHMGGYRDDTLQVRWLQLGVMSPINRLHDCSTPFTGKEPWKLGPYCEQLADYWLRLRHRLFPYLYTMNYRCHTELAPLISPMYYEYPEREAAYHVPNQYFFGTQLTVAPITSPDDPRAMLGKTKVYFPQGDWFDVFSGWHYRGEQTIDVHRPLSEMPIFAKAGGIVPLQDDAGNNSLGKSERMTVYVFPGADGEFALYEDEGDGHAYKNGVFAKTRLTLDWGETATFTIHGAEGDLSVLPEHRRYTVVLRGFAESARVTATCDGKPLSISAEYDAQTHSTVVSLPTLALSQSVVLTIRNAAMFDNRDADKRAFDVVARAQASNIWKLLFWQNVESKHGCRFIDYDESLAVVMSAVKEFLNLCPEE